MFKSAFFLSASALLAAAPAQVPLRGNGSASRAREYARELRVREAAADPGASSAWLSQALEQRAVGASWTDTRDALDALARALDARPELDLGRWRVSLRSLTLHEHPNVRAGAWRVLAHLPADGARHADIAQGVTTWEERMERARTLARWGADPARLAALGHGDDARIAELALAEGLQSSTRDDESLALAWTQAFEAAHSRTDERGIELLQLLELAPRAAGIAARVVELIGAHASEAPAEWNTIHALCLACLGRQGGSLDTGSLDRLCSQWNDASRWHPGARALLARAARALGTPLGERLAIQACSHSEDAPAALECFAGAIEALDPKRILRIVAAHPRAHATLAEPLFDSLRGRVESWDPDVLSPWLAPDVAASQRAHILLIVAETFRQNRDPGSAQILVRALEDPNPAAAAEAFQSLAGAPDPAPWMEAMHAAWARRPSAWREQRLADLSREIAWTPFLADLMELAAQSRASSARAAELLAPFRGDVEVAEALREWLEQDLARIREAGVRRGGPELDPRLVSSALSLMRALGLVADDQAVQSLVAALEASRGRSLELGKAAILQLGRSEVGRRGLRSWLAPTTHSRLRAEAAFALAPYPGREASIDVLLSDYANYDEDLRMRALRAFALADDGASANRLLEVARAPDAGAAEMLTAVECLGTRAVRDPGLTADMFGWLEESMLDPELRSLTIAALVKLGTPDVLARLAARFDALQQRGTAVALASRASQERIFEREAMITNLAAADAIELFGDDIPFEIPLERAADDFAARAAGQHRAETEFTCRAELALIAAFARAGRLERALESVAGWRGLDARFLLEIAARLPDEAPPVHVGRPAACERLALAALVGLGGELPVDDSLRARFEAQRRGLEAARQRGDALAFAARGAAFERDLRTGALPLGYFARAYGEFDPRRGMDPLAKLACDVHLARARVALALQNVDEARREAEAARVDCGASSAARAALAELASQLELAGH